MVRENNGAWQLYYIGRDYLGSITNVVSESGSVGYEYSYDAWGNLRNPDTQALYAQDEQPDLFLGRGFTGHEHLPFCNLINMNARLYDPAVGRFLSPDPYVQNSAFSQSYNRYSYAWNNPLRYTDQTGEKNKNTNYDWDPYFYHYRDDEGQLVDWSEVYMSVFESGCFRPGGSMFAEYTSYGFGFFSGSGGFPPRIVGGKNGARAGWKYINVPGSVTPVHKGDTYVDNGETWIYSCDDAVITGYPLPVPDMDAWLNAASNIVGMFSLDFTLTGNLKQNAFFWRDAQGAFRSTNILKVGANGKYVRGVQGLRNGYAIAGELSSTAKLIGDGLVVVGGLIAVGDMCINGINISNSLDLTMTAVNFIPGVGWVISGTYFLANFVTQLSTGQSIGQHIQNWISTW